MTFKVLQILSTKYSILCRNSIFLSILFAFIFTQSLYSQNTLKANVLGIYPNKQKVINKDIDLHGKTLILPDSVILKFDGGVIKNGTLIGNNTKILCRVCAFNNVSIQGSWDVPNIYSYWFENVYEENGLKNVLALTNSNIKNKVIISEGEYILSVDRDGQSCLRVGSYTDLQINGVLKLKPNTFNSCNIILAKGDSINIYGTGTIIGDKYSHIGTSGEWGMGVNVKNGKNVLISGITIKECWGDCIYVGASSENVKIDSCTLIDGRRQGISVTSANGVYISNCKISRVRGTAPQYGIDIEPNQNDTIDNIVIDNVTVFDCYGGILTYGKAKNAQIGSVSLKECKVYDCEAKYPIFFQKGLVVNVNECYVSSGKQTAILFQDINIATAKNNLLKSQNKQPIKVIFGKKNIISDNTIIK